jgi:AcrR family transcriptional regulator
MIAVARELFAQRPYSEVSTTDIASAAGVTHGLLTYHFGSKRNLYLAVLRSTLSVPRAPIPVTGADPDVDSALEDMTDWWLTQLERDREMWLAVLGARGMGRDPDVEELLDDIEERARAGLVAYLSAQDPADAPPELWAVVTAWQGLAEAVEPGAGKGDRAGVAATVAQDAADDQTRWRADDLSLCTSARSPRRASRRQSRRRHVP